MKDNRNVQFVAARREIIKELVNTYGEAGVRTKAKDYSFLKHVDDLAWKQVHSESIRDISSDRLRRKKKIKHSKKGATA
jgi:hypothetical protein